jgi:peptidoglycan/xylan/chitin deacetylase (PgdA/CDA1 family)
LSLAGRIAAAALKRWSPYRVRSRLEAPIASFCFDDFLASAFEAGGAVLERAGVRGTYYVSGDLAGTPCDTGVHGLTLPHFTPGHLVEAVRRGHEVGCHTFSHQSLAGRPGSAVDAECDRNAAFLRAVLGDHPPVSFAYPFGHASFAVKARVARRFATARGIVWGVNTGAMDFAQLRANPLDRPYVGGVDVDALIATAKAANGWLIFFTHDVSPLDVPFGVHPDRLARVVEKVLAAGIEVLPVKHAASRVRFGGPARDEGQARPEGRATNTEFSPPRPGTSSPSTTRSSS